MKDRRGQAKKIRRRHFGKDGESKPCSHCGTLLPFHRMTLDHVIPKSNGGRLTKKNTILSCGPCNNKRGNRSLEEFMASTKSEISVKGEP